MIVVPFKAEHLRLMDAVSPVPVSPEQALAMEQQSSWTALEGDAVLACAGVVRIWDGRYLAWAYMGLKSGPKMRAITKVVQVFLNDLAARRVELTVPVNYVAGRRWAELLGFRLETERMYAYGPDGSDHAMYVRVKP